MNLRKLYTLLTDLLNVLPGRSVTEWQELSSLRPEKPTVILVSGFAATNRNLSVMRKRLLKDGFNVVILSMDWQALSDGVRGLYRMSERLSSIILDLRKGNLKGKAKIYIVAHSAGGLVARYYIQLLGGFHYCDGLVTLGTPHRGTWIAALGLITHLVLKARCLFQMLPISPFIKKLNLAGLPEGFRLVSIYSTDDFMCPRKATRLPIRLWNQHRIESLEIKGVSHSDFLLSKEAYRLTKSYLVQDQSPVKIPPAPLSQQQI